MTRKPPAARPLTRKHDAFGALLEHGVTALVLDPRVEGTVVPAWLARQVPLVLNFSWRYNIKDFTFDDAEVVATLTFSGAPFRCCVPWQAVFSMRSEVESRAFTWIDEVPTAVQGGQKRRLEAFEPGVVLEQRGDQLLLHAVPVGMRRVRTIALDAAEVDSARGAPRPPRKAALRLVPGGPAAGPGGEAASAEATPTAAAPVAPPTAQGTGDDAPDSPPEDSPPPPPRRPALRLVR